MKPPSKKSNSAFWEKLYAGEKRASKEPLWGAEPTRVVRDFARDYRDELSGRSRVHVLDAGGGYGRNSLYLLRELLSGGANAHVTNIDGSPTALADFLANASRGGVSDTRVGRSLRRRVQVIPLDLAHLSRARRLPVADVVVVSHVLHALSKPDQAALLSNLQHRTTPGGFHVLAAWTNQVAYPDGTTERSPTWFDWPRSKGDPGDLRAAYEKAGWTVRRHEIATGGPLARVPHPQGKPYQTRLECLIAQKPAEKPRARRDSARK